MLNRNLFEFEATFDGFKYGESEKLLRQEKGILDYAFLVKLTKADFPMLHQKTVHILFGGGEVATVASVKYLIDNYEKLYNDFDNQHYFIAFPVNCLDGTYDSHLQYINMTNDMF